MHEGMVAHSLFETISEEAAKQNARPTAARISCGTLAAVNDEILCFAFEAVAGGTICEGMKIEVEHKPLQAKCRDCGRTFDVDFSRPKCPGCGGQGFDLLPDAPLILEQIEFQTD